MQEQLEIKNLDVAIFLVRLNFDHYFKIILEKIHYIYCVKIILYNNIILNNI